MNSRVTHTMRRPPAAAGPSGVAAFGLAALAILALACGPRPASRPGPAGPSACAVLPATSEQPDTLKIALPDPVDLNRAPVPGNYSESVLFHHLYETLVRLDCEGAVQPGLAGSWRAESGGRVWRFELREGARFWDGFPVTAAGVLAAWSGASARAALAAAGIDSVRTVGERALRVYPGAARSTPPGVLARPELGVAHVTDRTPWPTGSGPYRIGAIATEPSRAVVLVRAAGESDGPVLAIRSAAGRDARDLLEAEIDLAVTSDPAVIDYGATRPAYRTLPLPWDRTYLLLSTTRTRELLGGEEAGEGRGDELPSELTAALARDAVRGDARGHRSPGWWHESAACRAAGAGVGLPPVPAGAYRRSGTRRIIYSEGDGVARALAERIVALASAGPASASARALAAVVPGLLEEGALLAAGLDLAEYEASLRLGDDFAYVLGVPRRAIDVCYETAALSRRAEWLAVGRIDLAAAVIPLVDTRRYIIARRDRLALTLDWDATIHVPLWGAGRR